MLENRMLETSIKLHPAFSGQDILGSDGYTLPDMSPLSSIPILEENLEALKVIGISIKGRIGAGNIAVVPKNEARPINLSITLNGGNSNLIVIAASSGLSGSLAFEGDNNIAVIGSCYNENRVTAVFRYSNAGLFLGKGGSSPGTTYWIEGPERAVIVGDDYMFAWGIWLRTADSHGIIDLDSGTLINKPKSITVGQHVWIGQDALVMPGAVIGAGSIIGARSIVTKPIPRACVAVGSPAKVVRKKASWTRSANPSVEAITVVRSSSFAL